jgi:hypothetical protein
MGLIPIATSHHHRLEARLLNETGGTLRSYRYDETVKTWWTLWVLPLVNKNPRKVEDALIENMTRTLLRDLLRDEALLN